MSEIGCGIDGNVGAYSGGGGITFNQNTSGAFSQEDICDLLNKGSLYDDLRDSLMDIAQQPSYKTSYEIAEE